MNKYYYVIKQDRSDNKIEVKLLSAEQLANHLKQMIINERDITLYNINGRMAIVKCEDINDMITIGLTIVNRCGSIMQVFATSEPDNFMQAINTITNNVVDRARCLIEFFERGQNDARLSR